MKSLSAAVSTIALAALTGAAAAQDYVWDPDEADRRRAEFTRTMVDGHGFDRTELEEIFAGVEIRQSALNAISRPAERVVPWFEYREIFLNPERIEAGASFWTEHEALVSRVAEEFGVEPRMILAILGIESLFGERMGSYRVIDALSTLAFAYPPRADFFASELEAFLLIYREEGPAVLDGLGSYAGAMGAGQFIPSSYRAYAVDADGDGRRDLWQNWGDILASIANYLAVHGWEAGSPVAVPATQGEGPAVAPGNRLGLDTTVGDLRAAGYDFAIDLDADQAAMLVAVEGDPDTTAYFVGLNNFHVITRYNRSVKYALAAWELSEAIERRYRERQNGEVSHAPE